MALSVVQSRSATGSGSSMTLAYSSTPTAGNILVAWACANDEHVTALTRSGETVVTAFETVAAPGSRNSRFAYIASCQADADAWSLSTDGTDMALLIAEISAGTYDGETHRTHSSVQNPTTLTLGPSVADAIAIGVVFGDLDVATITHGSGWTELQEPASRDAQMQSKVLAATTAIASDWTTTNVANWHVGMALFIAAGGGAAAQGVGHLVSNRLVRPSLVG